MIKRSEILGMNARNHLYQSRYNRVKAKRISKSKLVTKSLLKKNKLSVPKLFRMFRDEQAVEKYDFTRLPESFVVKPSQGLGGEGILVIEKGGEFAGEWVTVDKEMVTIQDLRLHCKDILGGRFSRFDLPDNAFIEERVRVHPRFKPISFQGTPDVGVLVFNRVPVMAFLRLPTKESHGKANMFQGAVACGIDMATGVTTKGIKHTHEIKFFPGTRRKLKGIKIPRWDRVLKLAVKTAEVVGLGFCRVDIALQPNKTKSGKLKSKPMVLEINSQPGLKIQIANEAGLRRRLERVEGLKVKTVRQGIEIGKQLFAARDEDESIQGGALYAGVFEEVEVGNFLGEKQTVKAKIDTGAFRSSIDRDLAKELGLLDPENILWEIGYRSALGREERKVVGITFWLKGKKIKTSASVSDRSKLKRRMIIGRRDLLGFAIKVREEEAGREA
ncbi:MAG: sugar-transfer associated ATP-grasp domain-containing protein [Patescibacteria group bacterium]|nr:sugar-transfer associated ATP-grasp domain-containing protein [Patescibacteria group bacterium]